VNKRSSSAFSDSSARVGEQEKKNNKRKKKIPLGSGQRNTSIIKGFLLLGVVRAKAWSIGALGNPFWGKSSGHFSGQAPHLGPKLPILDPKLPSLDPKKLISPDSFPESIDHSKMHAFWPNQCAACFNLSRDDISSDASENSDGPEYCHGDFRCVCWFQDFVDGHLTSMYGLPDDKHMITEAETIETVRESFVSLPAGPRSFSGVEVMDKLDLALEQIYDASDGTDRQSRINHHIFCAPNRTIIKSIALRKMGRVDSFRSRKKFKIQ
jgi:hypothetical protein